VVKDAATMHIPRTLSLTLSELRVLMPTRFRMNGPDVTRIRIANKNHQFTSPKSHDADSNPANRQTLAGPDTSVLGLGLVPRN
jgi:hypothetical protein